MEACEYIERANAPPNILPYNFSGTGIFINKDYGYILTNEHVVSVCQIFATGKGHFFCPAIEIEYKIKNGTKFIVKTQLGAEVIFMTSPSQRDSTDIALVKMPNKSKNSLQLTKISPRFGEPIKAIGYPMMSKRPKVKLDSLFYSDADGTQRVTIGHLLNSEGTNIDLFNVAPKLSANTFWSDVDGIPGFSGSPTFGKDEKIIGLLAGIKSQAPKPGENANTEYIAGVNNPTLHIGSTVICDELRMHQLSQLVDGCDDQEFDYDIVADFLSQLKTWNVFPSIDGDPVENDSHISPLPPWVHNEFQKLQRSIFGKQVMHLQTCSSCESQSDSNRKIVFINPDFVAQMIRDYPSTKDHKEIIRFTLAHEICHYVYELGVARRWPYGRSLLGNKSIFGRGPMEPRAQTNLEQLLAVRMREGAWGHAEVDYYAGVSLLEMGNSNFIEPTIKFYTKILSEVTEDETGSEEMRARLTALRHLKVPGTF